MVKQTKNCANGNRISPIPDIILSQIPILIVKDRVISEIKPGSMKKDVLPKASFALIGYNLIKIEPSGAIPFFYSSIRGIALNRVSMIAKYEYQLVSASCTN